MEIKVGDGVDNGFTIVGDNADKLSRSKKFWGWFDKTHAVDLIKIRRVEEKWSLWGRDEKLVFALFQVEYLDEKKNKTSKVIFYRPDAVAVFLVLKDRNTKSKHVVLVEQVRVPAGQRLLEIPAGVVENDGEYTETAVREIEEEVTLKITKKNLRFLGLYYLSPGACPEKIALYFCELEFSGQEIGALEGRLAGLVEEGERIKVRIFPIEIFLGLGIRDAKTLLAYELYLQESEK